MIVLAIILTGIGSYAMRAFFIVALARYTFPPTLLRALEYVAPTVMAALVISMPVSYTHLTLPTTPYV